MCVISKMSNLMAVIAVTLFCLISFLNYMNRYTTPPVVGRLKVAFGVGDTLLSSIQTFFELCYVISSPLFGFMGDRLSRRYIIAVTLIFTAIIGFTSSFIPEPSFILLLGTRALLGVGEACSAIICPSLIADMFVGRKRTLVLSIYQLGIPLGCGVGFMLSSIVADYANDWRWAFRVTPLPMLISAFCLIAFVRDPQRGEAEESAGLFKPTTFREDVYYLMKVPSFILASLANIGAAYATGALTFWAPDLILRMLEMKGYKGQHSESETGFIFGVITIASGFFGILIGALVSSAFLKPNFGPAADGIFCGIAMFLAAPILFAGLVCIPVDVTATWLLIFFGIAAISSCYVLLSEITLSVVIVTRRATARAYQSTLAHLLGDAASPWLSGLISEHVKTYQKSMPNVDFTNVAEAGKVVDFTSMQTSLYLSTLIIAASGGLFLSSSFYINDDSAKTKFPPQTANKEEPKWNCNIDKSLATPETALLLDRQKHSTYEISKQ